MNRDQFEDLILTDEKLFAHYARLFMDSKDAQGQSLIDWCWRRYLDGERAILDSTGFGIDFYSDGATVFQEIRV